MCDGFNADNMAAGAVIRAVAQCIAQLGRHCSRLLREERNIGVSIPGFSDTLFVPVRRLSRHERRAPRIDREPAMWFLIRIRDTYKATGFEGNCVHYPIRPAKTP